VAELTEAANKVRISPGDYSEVNRALKKVSAHVLALRARPVVPALVFQSAQECPSLWTSSGTYPLLPPRC